MNFNIGDKVKFLNEKGQGIITRIINKTTVGVTIEDGFEIPYAISNLVVLAENNLVEKNAPVKPVTQVKLPIPKIITRHSSQEEDFQKEGEGIYLAFATENGKDISFSDINVWLINHTGYELLFSYSIWSNSNYLTLETGSLGSFSSELVQTIYRNELNDHRNFKIDALFYNKHLHDHQHPVSNVIKLKPIKLYKGNAFKTNNLLTDKALIFPVQRFMDTQRDPEPYMITEKKLSNIFFQKNQLQDRPKTSKPHISNHPANEMEIDLHIEELLEDYSNMSNAEIIKVQLSHFQNALDKAMNGHFKKLIVIHGVGNGRLKQEVRAIVAGHPSLKCYDASYARFGFGATEIQFF